jgi:hypothetical protein
LTRESFITIGATAYNAEMRRWHRFHFQRASQSLPRPFMITVGLASDLHPNKVLDERQHIALFQDSGKQHGHH